MNYKPKNRRWFTQRIGKRIYRDKQHNSDQKGACCATCADVEQNGLVVRDKDHAEYLAMIDADFAACGVYINYRDAL